MTFSYTLATDIGKVRLLIQDKSNTHDKPAHFSDEELQIFLTSGGSVKLAAAEALESWAASDFDLMDSEHMGDYEYTRGAVNKKLTLAKLYRDQDAAGLLVPAFGWAAPDLMGISDDDELDE